MDILHPRHRNSTTNHVESGQPAPLPVGLDMLSALIDANIGSRPTTEPLDGDFPVDVDPFTTAPSTTDPPHSDFPVDIDPFTTNPSTTDPLDGDFRVDDTDETPLFRLVQSMWPGAA